MSFDLATVSTLDVADRGTFLPFTHPTTGEPYKDSLNEDIGVTLRSRLSRAGQQFQREQAVKRLEMSRRGKDASVDDMEGDLTDLLVALTVSWSFDTLDSEPFPCNPDNARKLWSDQRFRGFRERANVFVATEANFTKR